MGCRFQLENKISRWLISDLVTMSNIIDTTIRYLEEKWPGRFIINFFGYLVVLIPIALGYVIIKKGMKLKSNDNDKLWVQFKNFMTNQIQEIRIIR